MIGSSMAARPNDSALSLAWLLNHIQSRGPSAEDSQVPDGSSPRFDTRATPAERWQSLAANMRAQVPQRADAYGVLDSDVWLCKSHAAADGVLVQTWAPPASLDDFGLDMSQSILSTWQFRSTRHSSLSSLISEQALWSDEDMLARSSDALRVYLRMHELARPPFFDPAHRSVILGMSQCLAWLNAALGTFFKGVVLTPIGTPDDIAATAVLMSTRIELVAHSSGEPLAEAALLAMYGADSKAGHFEVVAVPGGQGEGWRERWGWLSQESTAEEARRSLAMSGALLGNPAVVYPLLRASTGGDPIEAAVALCTLRRIALTLRVMAWAEDSLRANGALVRPKDILCFAYSAVRPEWPRRTVALSHRSSDVKQRLIETRFWSSPEASLDATFVPKWESNIAMIWGLFAPAPAIVRMTSKTYRDSEWCRRESEMLEHLLERGDFMQRVVIDASERDVMRLDDLLVPSTDAAVGVFPRRVELLSAPMLSPAESTVLSAAAAVRFIASATGGRSASVSAVVNMLCHGTIPTLDCPTNNADAWHGYVAIFRALVSTATGVGEAPIRLAHDYDSAVYEREREWWAKNSPDFLDPGVAPLRDHLCATEWVRFVQRAGEPAAGKGLVVDCRQLARDEWEHDPTRALQRGLLSAATTSPVWFLQRAEERVDHWAFIGDYRPIFTQHLDEQFSWMAIGDIDPGWITRYLSASDLIFSDAVIRPGIRKPNRSKDL